MPPSEMPQCPHSSVATSLKDGTSQCCHNCGISAPVKIVCARCSFAHYCSRSCFTEPREQRIHGVHCGILAAHSPARVALIIQRYADMLAIDMEEGGRCDVGYVRETWNGYQAGSVLLLFRNVRVGDAPHCAGQPKYQGPLDVMLEVENSKVIWL